MDVIIGIIVLVLGIFFLAYPLTVARIIALWPRFVFSNFFPNAKLDPRLKEAIHLAENDPLEYSTKYSRQLNLIQITGIVAVSIAIIGFCISLLSL